MISSTARFLAAGLLLSCIDALIIPQELPSILSLVYSNIPPVLKGTDSRVGVGFRFGEHADFQVLVEFGPQTQTQRLGGEGASSTSKKRQVLRLSAPPAREELITDTEGGKWLSTWKAKVSGIPQVKSKEEIIVPKTTVKAEPAQNYNLTSNLRDLYNSTNTENSTITENV